VVGTVVPLPGVLVGVLHQPEIYANAANAAIRYRDTKRDEAAGAPKRADARASRRDPDVTRGSTNSSGGPAVDARTSPVRH
jgi:hypothetical protein